MGNPVKILLLNYSLMNNEMTTIGIDVSKKTLDISIASEGKKKHEKEINEISGFEKIIASIEQFQLKKDVVIIIEATGGYHYGIVYYLLEQRFTNVKVINPSIAKSFSQMNNIRGTKTDKVDSILLAKLGKIHDLPSYRESKEDIEKKQIVAGLIGLRKSLREHKQRQNHFKHQLKVIQCDAILQSMNAVIVLLEKEIKKLEKLLCKLTEKDTQIISSIPGISEKGAAVISTQIGDISRFKNVKQIIAFSGLDPKIQESGTSLHGNGRISKKGNEILRCSLVQCAWYVYMQAIKRKGGKIFVDFVERLQKKNKHYYQILCAIAHKLLGIIFSLLKKGEKYKENHYFNLISV